MTLLGWSPLLPEALAGLALPALIVALSFRRRRPERVALGTARFFDDGGAAAASRRRWHLSAARWCAIAAVTLAVLAAARPRPGEREAPAYLLTAIVDRSPSMYLPMDPSRPDGERRIDRALTEVRAWLAELGGGGTRAVVRWRSTEPGGIDARREATQAPPGRLLDRPDRRLAAPLWGRLAGPGVLLVTDRAPADADGAAGVFTSGGPAIPGPVSAGADGLWTWSGRAGDALQRATLRARLRVSVGPEVPTPVAELAALWAEERGYEVGGPADGAALSLRRASGPGEAPVTERPGAEPPAPGPFRAGRDGWEASIRGTTGALAGTGGSPWLVGPGGEVLVRAREGEVVLDLGALEDVEGDEAFAVSWAGLLDGGLSAPPEVVALEERQGAGAAISRPPSLEDALDPEVAAGRARRAALGRRAELLLAAGAAVLALAALFLRTRGSA